MEFLRNFGPLVDQRLPLSDCSDLSQGTTRLRSLSDGSHTSSRCSLPPASFPPIPTKQFSGLCQVLPYRILVQRQAQTLQVFADLSGHSAAHAWAIVVRLDGTRNKDRLEIFALAQRSNQMKRINRRCISVHLSYTIREVATRLGVSRQTLSLRLASRRPARFPKRGYA